MAAETMQFVIGVDVGTSGVRCLISEADVEGERRVIGEARVSSRGIRKGEVVDFHDAVMSVRSAVERASAMARVRAVSVFATLGCGGIRGLNSRGAVRLVGGKGRISEGVVNQALCAACDVSIPSDRVKLHAFSRGFSVDGLRCVERVGKATGERLEAEVHVVTAPREQVEKLERVVNGAGYKLEKAVAEPIAAGLAVLSEDDRGRGADLLKLGVGSTAVVGFRNGVPGYTWSLGMGADHIVNDVGVATGVDVEEARSVCSDLRVWEDGSAQVKKAKGVHAARARLAEIMGVAQRELMKAGQVGGCGSGLWLCGWLSKVPGVLEEACAELPHTPRVPHAPGAGGIGEVPRVPEYEGAAGLLVYGWRYRLEACGFDLTAERREAGLFKRLLVRAAQFL